jgi:Listeria-Bacteroides repeat domain (List_Bact_rpt).
MNKSNAILVATLVAITISVCVVVYVQTQNNENNEDDNGIIEPLSPAEYSVYLSATEGGRALGAGSYYAGNVVTLTAISDSDYDFTGWYEGDALLSFEKTYRFVLHSNITIVATFEKTYLVSIYSIYDGKAGIADGGGRVLYGKTATLTTTVNYGYKFDGWYSSYDGTLLSDKILFEFTVTKDIHILCRYSLIKDATFTISQSSNNVPCAITVVPIYNESVILREWYVWDERGNSVEHVELRPHETTDGAFTFILNSPGTYIITDIARYDSSIGGGNRYDEITIAIG